MALQPDGKIVLAGASFNSENNDFAVARYNLDGSLDPAFGGGDGLITTAIGSGADGAESVAVQPDGKIVAAGYSSQQHGYDFAVARYSPDGTLDLTFAGDGSVTTDVSGQSDTAYAMAIQSDGRIVLAGHSSDNGDSELVRYMPDGTLDPTFGTGGIVKNHAVRYTYGVTIQPDGKIVSGGNAGIQLAVCRYLSSGSLDTSFDGDGIVLTSIGSFAEAHEVGIQPDNKIVAAGTSDAMFAVVRYTTTGSLDGTFSEDGISTANVGSYASGADMLIDSAGRVVEVGQANPSSSYDFVLARFLSDGALDPNFGDAGVVSTDIAAGFDNALGVAVQPDGKLVSAGFATTNGLYNSDFAAVRYFGDQTLGSGVPSDFNGDGYSDLAIGVPAEDIDSATDAGVVNVLYGSSAGLSGAGNQVWDQGSTHIGANESGDVFGFSLSAGDFNGDGFADIAVGAPGQDIGDTRTDAGMVFVLYGSSVGLITLADQQWTQDTIDVEDSSEAYDNFGYAVAAGDLNGDGVDDLAVGVAGEDIGSIVDAGAINVLYGSAAGLTATGDQFWSQDSTDVKDKAETGDLFGFALASGDLDGDGFADLISGVPAEDNGSIVDGGGINVLYGTASGLSATGNQWWNQNSTDIKDLCEAGDTFGFAVTAGDYDGDGYADLAAGVPFENNGSITDGGGVNVIYGTASGLAATGNQWWNQNSADIKDLSEAYDSFGYSIGSGDFDGDGYTDFVAGVAGENNGSILDGGATNVIYGTVNGLASADNQYWNQNSTGIEDSAEAGDLLGYTVTAGDFGNGTQADVVLAATFEDVGSITDAGAINVIYGTATGLNAAGDQFWNQDSPDIADTAEAGDEFGFGLSFGPGTRPGTGPLLPGRG